jgi:hypothetical protein
MLEQELNNYIHKVVAKEVEYNAALARQFGFDIPKSYELGFSATSGPIDRAGTLWEMVMTLRLNDFTWLFKIKLPGAGRAEDDSDLVPDLFRAAGELVARYIDEHPEVKPDSDISKTVLELMSKLGSDEEFHKRAVTTAETATYSEPVNASRR